MYCSTVKNIFIFFLMGLFSALIWPNWAGAAPRAYFDARPLSGVAPLKVIFTDYSEPS